MYAIDSKEDFKQELCALLQKIENQIDSFSIRMGADPKGIGQKDIISKLNILKLQVFKIQETELNLVEMTDERWMLERNHLQNQYKDIHSIFKNSDVV